MSTRTESAEARERRIRKGAAARETLERCKVNVALDFHALPRSTVDALLDEAKAQGYRKPKNANGSRVRYFHSKLMRDARRVLHLNGRWV